MRLLIGWMFLILAPAVGSSPWVAMARMEWRLQQSGMKTSAGRLSSPGVVCGAARRHDGEEAGVAAGGRHQALGVWAATEEEAHLEG